MALSNIDTDKVLELVGKYLTASSGTSLREKDSGRAKVFIDLLTVTNFEDWYTTNSSDIKNLWNDELQIIDGVTMSVGDFACTLWFTFHKVEKQ